MKKMFDDGIRLFVFTAGESYLPWGKRKSKRQNDQVSAVEFFLYKFLNHTGGSHTDLCEFNQKIHR